jgi:hypothetical protein
VIYEPEVERLPRERLRSLQTDRLRSLIDYVKDRVPLYRERLADAEPEDIASLDDLRQRTRSGCSPSRATRSSGSRLRPARPGS